MTIHAARVADQTAALIAQGMAPDVAHDLATAQVAAESSRALTEVPDRVDGLLRVYLAETGTITGQAWRRPSSALESYPLGWAVTWSGGTHVSLVVGNISEPGTAGSGWASVLRSRTLPEWSPLSGYNKGDEVVTTDPHGVVVHWVSLTDGNSDPPSAKSRKWMAFDPATGARVDPPLDIPPDLPATT